MKVGFLIKVYKKRQTRSTTDVSHKVFQTALEQLLTMKSLWLLNLSELLQHFERCQNNSNGIGKPNVPFRNLKVELTWNYKAPVVEHLSNFTLDQKLQ